MKQKSTADFTLKIDTSALSDSPDDQIVNMQKLFDTFAHLPISHIHLTLETPRRPNKHFWRGWIRLLARNFYKNHFALIWCSQIGSCSDKSDQNDPVLTINTCEYRISLIKVPSQPKVLILAPISGLGEFYCS